MNNNEEFHQRLKDTENAIKFMVETMNTFLGYYKQNTNYSTFEIKEPNNWIITGSFTVDGIIGYIYIKTNAI